jgi:hypothetical protein
MNIQKKLRYARPQARDLSVHGALGAGCKTGPSPLSPQGMCLDGSALTTEFCTSGPAPAGGACSPTGVSPAYGYCNLGNIAVEGCISGGVHI